jgi:hypothetical protein
MNYSIKSLDDFLNEKYNHLNENDSEVEKLKAHLAKLKNYNPGDDSPYADIYGGYTVSDSRREIRNKLERLGAIKHKDPSPSAISKRKESIKKQQGVAKELNHLKKSDPKFKIAAEIKGMQYTITSAPSSMKNRMKSSLQPKIDKLLKKGEFTSIANAVNYYNDNKPDK